LAGLRSALGYDVSGYDNKIQDLDKILGRSSAGYVTMQTKAHDFLKDIEEFAKTL
jgi:hypothetical protein